MYEAIVVGAGLFGAVIAQKLRDRGLSVLVIDAGYKGSGSKPAACLMKPSWFSGLGKEVYTPALNLLDQQYGLEEVQFKAGPLITGVKFCPPQRILKPPDLHDRVTGVKSMLKGWQVGCAQGTGIFAGTTEPRHARMVILAAGVWTNSLVQVDGLRGLAGAAFLWRKASIAKPFIHPWAPYKQVVAFNRGDGLWCGDGTAIKPENWNAERELTSRKRCADNLRMREEPEVLYGIRPYVPSKPCYLREYAPGLWVATGGAKNGLLAAAWCAAEISKSI